MRPLQTFQTVMVIYTVDKLQEEFSVYGEMDFRGEPRYITLKKTWHRHKNKNMTQRCKINCTPRLRPNKIRGSRRLPEDGGNQSSTRTDIHLEDVLKTITHHWTSHTWSNEGGNDTKQQGKWTTLEVRKWTDTKLTVEYHSPSPPDFRQIRGLFHLEG